MKAEENIFNFGLVIAFFLALALVLFMIFFVNIPLSPINDTHTNSREIRFDWAGLSGHAFLDDNPDFVHPGEVRKGEILNLESGKYYWKIPDGGMVNEFSIDSEVSIIKKDGRIKNTGNVQILVEFFRKMGLTNKAVLEINESNEMEGDLALASEFDDKSGHVNQTDLSKNEN